MNSEQTLRLLHAVSQGVTAILLAQAVSERTRSREIARAIADGVDVERAGIRASMELADAYLAVFVKLLRGTAITSGDLPSTMH